MPIDKIRCMPTDKILSNGLNPQMYTMMKQLEKSPNRNPQENKLYEDSDDSFDLDLANLPPPRRSPVSRQGPRRLISGRNLIMLKLFLCLSVLFLVAQFVPRHTQTIGTKSSNDLAILLWNEENRTVEWKHHECHCVVTNNRNYTDRSIDAVVINVDWPYSLLGLDMIRHTPHFLVVFAARNPLSLAKNPLTANGESIFNFTMSYRLDSDLIWTEYYFANKRHENQRVKKFLPPDKNFMQNMTDLAASHLRFKLNLKHHPVVYMFNALNNYTRSESLYLEKLREHIEVDAIQTCHEPNECMPYQFMLIFEPSSCPDYVHPHFYMALSNFVVPVLIGGGNLSQLVPPGSYISGNDYDSPQKLAEHLKMFSEESQLYEQFFWWHSKYQLQRIRKPYCALCHQLRQHRRRRHSEEFLQWWTQYMCPNPMPA